MEVSVSQLSLRRATCFVCLICAAGATASRAHTFKTLLNFNGTDGKYPAASLVQGFDGNFYGTTFEGGAHGLGTAFKMTPGGKLITFYSFCGEASCAPDGAYPEAGLVQATNGNLYGTTYGGGANGNFGTVFQITAGGKLTTLLSFDKTDGATSLTARCACAAAQDHDSAYAASC